MTGTNIQLSDDNVLRFVITYVNKDGHRTIAEPAVQGRFTYPDVEMADQALADRLHNNSVDRLRNLYGDDPQFEVRPCWCWRKGNDPTTIYFD